LFVFVNRFFTGEMMIRRLFAVAIALVGGLVLGHSATALGTEAVFDPADGFWYKPVLAPTGITWTAAEADAVAAGGYLASPNSAAENNFVFSLVDTDAYWTGLSVHQDILGPWLGAFASNDTNGSDATWHWENGVSFSFAPWGPNQPDGYPGDLPNQAVDYYAFANIGSTWGDTPQDGVAGFSLPQGYVIQYNTDPNGSGSNIVPLPEAGKSGLVVLVGLLGIGIFRAQRKVAS
jgi:hypothetical protein